MAYSARDTQNVCKGLTVKIRRAVKVRRGGVGWGGEVRGREGHTEGPGEELGGTPQGLMVLHNHDGFISGVGIPAVCGRNNVHSFITGVGIPAVQDRGARDCGSEAPSEFPVRVSVSLGREE